MRRNKKNTMLPQKKYNGETEIYILNSYERLRFLNMFVCIYIMFCDLGESCAMSYLVVQNYKFESQMMHNLA